MFLFKSMGSCFSSNAVVKFLALKLATCFCNVNKLGGMKCSFFHVTIFASHYMYLFNDAIGLSDYMASNDRMIKE
jgi:hypothetical protein